MRNCFCFRSSFDAASSCRPRRWAYGHLKLQEKNKVRLSVPPAVSRQSSPSRRAYPVVGEGLRHCRPLIRGCRRRLLIAGPLCFLVVFIFFYCRLISLLLIGGSILPTVRAWLLITQCTWTCFARSSFGVYRRDHRLSRRRCLFASGHWTFLRVVKIVAAVDVGS